LRIHPATTGKTFTTTISFHKINFMQTFYKINFMQTFHKTPSINTSILLIRYPSIKLRRGDGNHSNTGITKQY
jgi:hypothetical protein